MMVKVKKEHNFAFFSAYCLGFLSEFLCILYFILHFYLPIAWRFKSKLGEIDLIFFKKNILFFIEVKYRSLIHSGDNYVSYTQKKRIQNAALIFIKQKNIKNCIFQFDYVFLSCRYPFFQRISNVSL